MPMSKEWKEFYEETGSNPAEFHQLYARYKQRSSFGGPNARYSHKDYENSPEKLQKIKEKYKNGVTSEHIKEMIDDLC